jgi:hypothetical protein
MRRARYPRDLSARPFGAKSPPTEGSNMPSEVEHLRREVRDLRYVAEATLMALVGKDKTILWKLEARVESAIAREGRGTPLAEVGIGGYLRDRLTSTHWDGQDIQTVEELVSRWSRDEVAAMEGIGRKTLEKIDATIAGRSRVADAWADVPAGTIAAGAAAEAVV